MGERAARRALVAGICAIATLVLPAFASATTYYASPTGENKDPCTKISPCDIETVLSKVKDNDTVFLQAGSYTLPFAGVVIDHDIDFGGERGAPAVLKTTNTADVQVNAEVKASLHDLRIEGVGALIMFGGFGQRLYVSTGSPSLPACLLEPGTTLRDSVCWAHPNESEIEDEPTHGVSIEASGEGDSPPVVLRNVTAWSTGAAGAGINALGASGAHLLVDAKNVIAHSDHHVDIIAERGTGTSKSIVDITNSNFSSFEDDPSDSVVTPPGVSGNISSPPSLANPSEGDFHQNEGSPTLDGGLLDGLVGPFDLDGSDRVHSKCFGAAPVPDMGAYERSPTAACPPPPPAPPPPLGPIQPVFRVVSLHLNKKTGGGRLLVEVPGAGTLSLAGSGVKLVRRTAPAEGGVITLPIQLWIITRVRLNKVGKTRVRLNVTFDGRGGVFEEWSKGVLLRKQRKSLRDKRK